MVVLLGTKFVPVREKVAAVPRISGDGLIVVSVGTPGAAFTVKGTVPLVPAEVVTLTLWAPSVALLAMVKVAVMVVLFMTVTPLGVTPVPLTLIVAPETKVVPVSVTPMIAPCTLLEGLRETWVGGGGVELTVKVTVPLVPPAVVTLTFCAPSGALPAMVKVAVMVVLFMRVTALGVIPVPLKLIVAP